MWRPIARGGFKGAPWAGAKKISTKDLRSILIFFLPLAVVQSEFVLPGPHGLAPRKLRLLASTYQIT